MIKFTNSFFSFVFEYIDKHIILKNNKAKILDFGCGKGEIVKLAMENNYNIYGCDNFYDGEQIYIENYDKDLVDLIPESGLLLYSDESFDFIYSNQVFEHINNLETTLSELNRILKKGRQMLNYFPVKECILEGHFGIPFQHRLFNNDKLKKFYLKFFYMLGIGFNRNSSFEEWCMKAIDFVDNYCFYRNKREILSSF